jgi:serpin B
MKKIWIAAALVLACLSGLRPTVLQASARAISGGHKQTRRHGRNGFDTTEFALSLLKNTYTGENTVVSPVSAYLALAMTANGAAGETLREFERVLGASLGELNDTGKLLLDAFNEASGVTLKAAAGIWYNTAGSFARTRFLRRTPTILTPQRMRPISTKPATLDEINGYISDNTNG